MQQERIPFARNVDYHSNNADDDPTVLRFEADAGRYCGIYFRVSIGDVVGEYDSLTDSRGVFLTRSQVVELIRDLANALAANS